MPIEFSKKTIGLASQLFSDVCFDGEANPTVQTSIQQIKDLYKRIDEIQPVNDTNAFLMTQLNLSLLEDIAKSLSKEENEMNTSPEWTPKAKLVLLAVAGTLYFGCEGFDGITAIASMFLTSTVALLSIGAVFSILSIVVFCSFDLVEISKNLGVTFSHTPKMLDILFSEFEQIKKIRRQLTHFVGKNKEELDAYLSLAELLQQRHHALDTERTKLLLALNSPSLQLAKRVTALLAGVIFFSGGYFTGQAVAVSVASLFFTAASTTLWPVILASSFVGLAAFAIYWFVERPGIENFINSCMHLDKEKVDKLCDIENVEKESHKLNKLVDDLRAKKTLLTELEDIKENPPQRISISPAVRSLPYGFFKPEKSIPPHQHDNVDRDQTQAAKAPILRHSLSLNDLVFSKCPS